MGRIFVILIVLLFSFEALGDTSRLIPLTEKGFQKEIKKLNGEVAVRTETVRLRIINCVVKARDQADVECDLGLIDKAKQKSFIIFFAVVFRYGGPSGKLYLWGWGYDGSEYFEIIEKFAQQMSEIAKKFKVERKWRGTVEFGPVRLIPRK